MKKEVLLTEEKMPDPQDRSPTTFIPRLCRPTSHRSRVEDFELPAKETLQIGNEGFGKS